MPLPVEVEQLISGQLKELNGTTPSDLQALRARIEQQLPFLELCADGGRNANRIYEIGKARLEAIALLLETG